MRFLMYGRDLGYLARLLYSQTMTEPRRIIVEIVNVGNVVKVTAVCEDTGREVSMVGDPRVSKAELERIAINKLKFVMRKEAPQQRVNTRGIIV